jgi:hypothetical protein
MKKIIFTLIGVLLLVSCAPLAYAASAQTEGEAAVAPSGASLQEYLQQYDTFVVNNDFFYSLFGAYAVRAKSNLGILSRINAQKHLEHNKAFDQELYVNGKRAFIDDQRSEPIVSMRYGTRNMWYNGCELIAVYNALLALGRPKDLSEIVYRFESAGAVWMEAEFGTKIAQYKAYLRKQGLDVKEFREAKSLDEVRQDGDVFIITYSWKNAGSSGWDIGIHTIMAKQVGGQVEAHNNGGGLQLYDSFEQLLLSCHGYYLLGYQVSA